MGDERERGKFVKQIRSGEHEKNNRKAKKENGATEKEIKHKAAQMRPRQGAA